ACARFPISFAQVEYHVWLKGFERFHKWTHALVQPKEAGTMAERLDRVMGFRRRVDQPTDNGLPPELHRVVDHRDRAWRFRRHLPVFRRPPRSTLQAGNEDSLTDARHYP